MKNNIDKADLKFSGVYCISNYINKKIYVGSTKSFQTRFRDHRKLLLSKTHSSKQLQSFVNKYGIDALEFSVLEFCDVGKLLTTEQIYLDKLKPFNKNGFNTLKIAGSPLGYKHSAEVKSRISLLNKGRVHTKEAKANMSMGQQNRDWKLSDEGRKSQSLKRKGKILSEHTRSLISTAHKGRIHSKKAKSNMSKAHLGKRISESQKRNQSNGMLERNMFGKMVLNVETGIYFNSGIEAAKAHNIHAVSLNRKLQGVRKNDTQFIRLN